MRNIILVAVAALSFSIAAQAAHVKPKHVRKPVASTAALPGTYHFGPDQRTGKWKRLSDKEVAPRSPGTAALEYDARRDGTNRH